MNRLIECVPNFSEGRDASKVAALVDAMSGVPGAWVLDRTSDGDHNRSVITLAGEPEAVAEAALRGAGAAAELIDLTDHAGAHPRIGATDVIPFVPLEGVSMEECVALAHYVGHELWDRYRIPVYFYGAAAIRPERVNLENVRRGQFEGLREEALRDPDRSPDIGEPRLHPTAGAVAVGVRKLLIAYNIHLNTRDVDVAKEIAKAIRHSSGGLRYVKAIGLELKARGLAQVSINLIDFEQTPLHRVFEMAKREAERHGCTVLGSEIVGLIPRKAIELAADYYLQLENFSPALILENRLTEVAGVATARMSPPNTPGGVLQLALEALRATVQVLAGRAASTSPESLLESEPGTESQPETATDAHMAAATLAAQIYEQLVQLETMAAPSMVLDLLIVRQMAMAAALGALKNVEALLPSLRDVSRVETIKSLVASIGAKLSGKPAVAEN